MAILKLLKSNIFLITLVICLYGLILLPPKTMAQTPPVVVDDANLFSTTEKQSIETAIQSFESKYQLGLVVVTTNQAHEQSTQAYADDFYDNGGYGFDSSRSGALFLIDLHNRQFHLSTTGYMRAIFPESQIKTLSNNITQDMVAGNYFEATMTVIDRLSTFAQKKDSTGVSYDPSTDQIVKIKQLNPIKWLIAIVLGSTSALVFYFTIRSKYQLKKSEYHYPYLNLGQLDLTESNTHKTLDITTHRHIPKPPQNGGGSHMGSSGTNHGGGGGSF